MKRFLTILVFGFALTACTKDDPGKPTASVDQEGLTVEIRQLFPDNILSQFKSIGIAINGGNNPPDIEGHYTAITIFARSNFADSMPVGFESWMAFSFKKPDYSTLKVDCNSGERVINAYITGNGSRFSVFMECTVPSSTFKTLEIVSGEYTAVGIQNFQWAVMATVDAPGSYSTGLKKGQMYLYETTEGLVIRR